MKNLALVFAIFAILFSCKKDQQGNQATGAGGITIKGKISGTKNATLKSGALALTDATKVLVFNPFKYTLANIVNGSFTVKADVGSVTALIFLDANNKYIGNLFAGGLNMLPLGGDQDSTTIDLQSLTLNNTSVVPEHNPIGDEISISAAEVTRLQELGGFFEALAQNLDADNDGVPDVLSNKQLSISSQFQIFQGHPGIDNTPPQPFDASQLQINYLIRISGNISMAPANGNSVALSGPVANPYTDIKTWSYIADKCFIAFFNRSAGSQNVPFKKGTYSFTLNGSQFYSLNYSNINAQDYLVIASPTLHTDGHGMVTSISLEYKLPDNITTVDPAKYVSWLQLQYNDDNNNHVEIGTLYAGVPMDNQIKDITNVALPAPVSLSTLKGQNLYVNYNDLLGNEYFVLWNIQ